MEIFAPYTQKKTAALINQAREENTRRDRIDRNSGWATPADADIPGLLRTVISALVCGIEIKDWKCVAEGIAMLQERECQLRHAEYAGRTNRN